MNIAYVLTLIFGAVVLLGICIFIHELGHLLGGKMVGIKARVFSLGYGKGVLKKKFGDTTYQITLIPFGGYCQFYGDEPGEERKGESWEFLSAHPLKRIVPVVMGPLFNLFLGIVIFFMMNLIGYQKESNRVVLLDNFLTERNSGYVTPAKRAGIADGDRIVEIAGEKVMKFTDIQKVVFFSHGRPLAVKAERGGQVMSFMVTPEESPESKGRFSIGVMPFVRGIQVGKVMEGDAGARAGLRHGDVIRSTDGRQMVNPAAFTAYIRERQGQPVSLVIDRNGSAVEIAVVPALREEFHIQQFKDSKTRGEQYNVTLAGAQVQDLKTNIAAGKVRVNDAPVASYEQLLATVRAEKSNILKIENGAAAYRGLVEYRSFGFIGVETGVAEESVEVRYGLVESFARAFVEPYDFIVMNLKGIGMLFSGKLNVRENLSGPIFIAKIAGDVFYYRGLSSFIILMAQISIILMVMNLLPIPMVDGSYIVLFFVEWVRGKPLSDKVMEKIQLVGMVLLILLGVFVVFNDIAKIFNFM